MAVSDHIQLILQQHAEAVQYRILAASQGPRSLPLDLRTAQQVSQLSTDQLIASVPQVTKWPPPTHQLRLSEKAPP